MPRNKKSDLSTLSNDARRMQLMREMETEEETKRRLSMQRVRQALLRSREDEAAREKRLRADRMRQSIHRALESRSQRLYRLEADRLRHAKLRQNETETQRRKRLEADRLRHFRLRQAESESQRQRRLEADRIRHFKLRQNESNDQNRNRLETDRLRPLQLDQSQPDKLNEMEIERLRQFEISQMPFDGHGQLRLGMNSAAQSEFEQIKSDYDRRNLIYSGFYQTQPQILPEMDRFKGTEYYQSSTQLHSEIDLGIDDVKCSEERTNETRTQESLEDHIARHSKYCQTELSGKSFVFSNMNVLTFTRLWQTESETEKSIEPKIENINNLDTHSIEHQINENRKEDISNIRLRVDLY